MRPILLPTVSVNHTLPSGPLVMYRASAGAVGIGYSAFNTPASVITPILLTYTSANQRFPSGPSVIPLGPLAGGSGNSVMTPFVVMRPILLPPPISVNQTLPSELTA